MQVFCVKRNVLTIERKVWGDKSESVRGRSKPLSGVMLGGLVDTQCLSSVQGKYIALRSKYSSRNVDVTLSSTASVTRWRPGESARLPGSHGLEGGSEWIYL